MKSLKMKLTSAIIMVVLAIAMLIVGVWAAQTQTLTMTGSVNFEIADKSLYVKDVKIKNDNVSGAESIDSFLPGYINGEFNMNLTTIPENTLGTFQLHFYIINTSQTAYTVTYTLSDELQSQNISVTLQNSEIPSTTLSDGENITQDTPESVILILQVSAPNMDTLDLSGITLHIDEKELQVYDEFYFEVINENEINILLVDSPKTEIVIPSKVSIEKQDFTETYFPNGGALSFFEFAIDPLPSTFTDVKSFIHFCGKFDVYGNNDAVARNVYWLSFREVLDNFEFPIKVVPLNRFEPADYTELQRVSNSLNYLSQNGGYYGNVIVTGGSYNSQEMTVAEFYNYVNSIDTISQAYTITLTENLKRDVLVDGDDYTVTHLAQNAAIQFIILSNFSSIVIPSTITFIEDATFAINSFFEGWPQRITNVTIESAYVFQNAGPDDSMCGALLFDATTVKVLASLIDDEGLTNEYLDSSGSFTRVKEGDYYVYTKN